MSKSENLFHACRSPNRVTSFNLN